MAINVGGVIGAAPEEKDGGYKEKTEKEGKMGRGDFSLAHSMGIFARRYSREEEEIPLLFQPPLWMCW